MLAVQGRWFVRLDNTVYDVSLALWERRPSPSIVIVAIDDASLARIGRWPWPRAVHAELLQRLGRAGPAAVGLDLILAEPDAKADPILAQAIRNVGRVVLPVYAELRPGGRYREIRPLPVFESSAVGLGHIHVELDVDGVARQIFLRDGINRADWPHFAEMLRRVAVTPSGERVESTQSARAGEVLVRQDPFLIPFVGAPGSFQQVSYASLLTGDIPAESMRDKIVLIGATATGLGDTYPTPVSAFGRPMPGIEISANVLDALQRGYSLRTVTPLVQSLVSASLVLGLLALFMVLSPRRSLVAAAIVLLGTIALSAVVLRGFGFWFPPGAALIVLTLAYPLWSWRRLEAATRHLDLELARASAAAEVAAPLVGYATPPISSGSSPSGWSDVFVKRLSAAHDAGEQLWRTHRVLAQSLAGLPVAVLVADRTGRVVLSNTAAHRALAVGDSIQLGAAQDCLAGIERDEAAGPTDWAALIQQATFEHTTSVRDLMTESGASFLVSIAPYALVDDAAIGSIITLVDVSALKRLEREQGEFMQFISHDMRTPQTSILALLELDREDPGGMPRTEVNARIDAHVRRTLALIDGILNLASAERAAAVGFIELDLAHLVQESVDEAWASATAASQRIELHIDVQPAWVRGDRQLLLRAIGNLISNALKYSAPNGMVSVSVKSNGLGHVCRVDDSGRGIPPDAFPKLFQKFQRVHTAGTPDPGGLGLGLVIVKTIAERHGGGVRVESEPGRGSSFELWLPAIDVVERDAPVALAH